MRLTPNPVSLESHSSKLNQSRLFDSIQTASWAEERKKTELKGKLTLSNFDELLTISCLLYFPFLPPLYYSLTGLLEAGIIGSHFMLRYRLNFFFQLPYFFFKETVITTVCLKDQVRVIKYAKANCIFAQVSSLEIFHQGTLLFFPNVVMNFKVDLFYWRREVCDQNTEQSSDWTSLFLEH